MYVRQRNLSVCRVSSYIRACNPFQCDTAKIRGKCDLLARCNIPGGDCPVAGLAQNSPAEICERHISKIAAYVGSTAGTVQRNITIGRMQCCRALLRHRDREFDVSTARADMHQVNVCRLLARDVDVVPVLLV